jgi:hypothetical protein
MTEDVVATTRKPPDRPTGRQQRLAQLAGAAVAFAVVLAVSLGYRPPGPEKGVFTPDHPPAVRILVLGDPSAGRGGCAGCPTYSEQMAEAVRRGGRTAYVDDQTWSANAWPSANLAGMTGALHADPAVAGAVAAADVIVLAMGAYDVRLVDGTLCRPPDVGVRQTSFRPDSRCNRRGVNEVRRRLDGLSAEITRLRQGRPVVIRLVTPPPASTEAAHAGRIRQHTDQTARKALELLATVECDEIARTGGSCVDLGQLLDAEAIPIDDPQSFRQLLSARAHEIVARELLAQGLV